MTHALHLSRIAMAVVALLIAPLLHAEPLTFGVFGDLPYSERERAQLPRLIEEMGSEALAFVIHDGDIKNGRSACSDEVMQDMLGVFQASPHPLIYVPGDNEWTDCHRRNNGGYDPLERLAKLRSIYFADDFSLGAKRIRLERQSTDARFAAYRENVRWTASDIMFVGLNVPGSDNNHAGTGKEPVPSREFTDRRLANTSWLEQSFAQARSRGLRGMVIVIQANPDFEALQAGRPTLGYRELLWSLRQETQKFPGEVVLFHGDTHSYRVDHPLLDAASGAPLANFTRVETYGSPFIGWVKVSIDPKAARLFTFEPRLYREP